MKFKRFDKKLALHKSTISDLTKNEMNGALGGIDQTHWTFCDCTTFISCNAHCETEEIEICPRTYLC